MPPSPRVPTIGVVGNKVTFKIQGRMYQTGAVAPSAASTLTEAQANELIRTGQATPLQNSYLDQFPWTNLQSDENSRSISSSCSSVSFDQWCAFHSIQRGHREEQERAAQRMVDTANALRALKPKPHLNG